MTNILDSSRDLERIGDHAESLINLTDYLIRKKVVFSDNALAELEDIYQQTATFVKDALRSVEEDNKSWQQSWNSAIRQLKSSKRNCGRPIFLRLNKGECTPQAGVNFIDMISHYTCCRPCHEFSREGYN